MAGQLAHHLPDPALMRDLYTRILPAERQVRGAVIGVTSALDGEGKTTTALGLALTLVNDFAASEGGRSGSIVVVDAGPDRHGSPATLGVDVVPGLLDALRGSCSFPEVVKRSLVPQLDVVPLGSGMESFGSLIRGTGIRDFIEVLRESHLFVILDLPPVLASTDARVLAGLADVLVLVVRAGRTDLRQIQAARDQMPAGSLAGVVLNGVQHQLPGWLDRIF